MLIKENNPNVEICFKKDFIFIDFEKNTYPNPIIIIGYRTNAFALELIAKEAKTAISTTYLILFGSLTNFKIKKIVIVENIHTNESVFITEFIQIKVGTSETKAVKKIGSNLLLLKIIFPIW